MAEKIGLQAVLEDANFQRGLANYMRGLDQMNRATGQASQSMTQSSGAIDGLGSAAGSAGGPVGALGVAVGNLAAELAVKLVSAAWDAVGSIVEFGKASVLSAARVQELDFVIQILGERAGYSKDELDATVQSIRELGIRTDVAQNLVAQFIRNELDLADATNLARVAQDAAVLSMSDSSDALQNLLHGITTQNSRVLRNAGVMVMAGQAIEDYADSLGIAKEELDPTQRAQAVLNGVLAEGERITGAYTAAMEAPGKQLRSFKRYIDDLAVAVGTPLLGAFGDILAIGKDFLKWLIEAAQEGGELNEAVENIADAFSQFVRDQGPKALDWAKKFVGNVIDLLTRLSELEPETIENAIQFGKLAVAIGLAFSIGSKIVTLIPTMVGVFKSVQVTIAALPGILSAATAGWQLYTEGATLAQIASLGLSASLGPLAIVLGVVAAAIGVAIVAHQRYQQVQERTQEVTDTWTKFLGDQVAAGNSAIQIADEYANAQGRVARSIDETRNSYAPADQLALMFIDTQKLLAADMGKLQETLLATAANWDEYAAATDRVNQAAEELGIEQRIHAVDRWAFEWRRAADVQAEVDRIMAENGETIEEITNLMVEQGLRIDELPASLQILIQSWDDATRAQFDAALAAKTSGDAVVEATEEALAAAERYSISIEELKERQADAWQSFSQSVQDGVGRALAAYREGNEEMLAEQQAALAEMLWNQTDQMLLLGQITSDQAMAMKSAVADAYGIMVNETEITTNMLLGMFGDWAAGGETTATEIVGFLENIGEHGERLTIAMEEDIAQRIATYEEEANRVRLTTEEISGYWTAIEGESESLATTVTETGGIWSTATQQMGVDFGDLASQLGEDSSQISGRLAEVSSSAEETGMSAEQTERVWGAATSLMGDHVGELASRLGGEGASITGTLDNIKKAVENIPSEKHVKIVIEKVGSEDFDLRSPTFVLQGAIESLVEYARNNPVNIRMNLQTGRGVGAIAGGDFGINLPPMRLGPTLAAYMVGSMGEILSQRFELAGALSALGSTAAKLLEKRTLEPLEAQMSSLDDQIEKVRTDLETAPVPAWLNIMEELERLEGERARVGEEYRRQQEKILELQKQQENLQFLQQQVKLLDLIAEHGLDATQILGDMDLGVNASLESIVEAMSRATEAIIEQTEQELGFDRLLSMEEIAELERERAEAAREYAEQQERILALEKAQADLAFLNDQIKLLDMIVEHGLDAEQILGGMLIGADASAEDYMEAMTRAISEIVRLTEEQTGAADEYIARQERILELQEAQAKLDFLKEQIKLLDMIADYGLDATQILGGMALGAEASAEDFTEAMIRAINAIIGITEQELQAQSPSRVFMGFGRDIMEGLALGIEQFSSLPMRALEPSIVPSLPSVAGMVGSQTFSTSTRGGDFNVENMNVNNGMDAAELRFFILETVREGI